MSWYCLTRVIRSVLHLGYVIVILSLFKMNTSKTLESRAEKILRLAKEQRDEENILDCELSTELKNFDTLLQENNLADLVTSFITLDNVPLLISNTVDNEPVVDYPITETVTEDVTFVDNDECHNEENSIIIEEAVDVNENADSIIEENNSNTDTVNNEPIVDYPIKETEDVRFVDNAEYHIEENSIITEKAVDVNEDVDTIIEKDNNNTETGNNYQKNIAISEENYTPDQSETSSSEDNNGKENNPNKANESRKRKRNVSEWKRAQAKMKRNKGEEYFNRKKYIVQARTAKETDCSKCKLKCSEKVTFEDVLEVHKTYWGTGSYERQREFICKYVQRIPVHRRRKNTTLQNTNNLRRNFTLHYFFPGNRQVCKRFFLNSLNIGEKTVQIAKKKELSSTSIIQNDMRGHHTPANKTSRDKIDKIKEHIESFPKLQSHYCRSSTKRLYLSSDLNMTKMFELYLEKCKAENLEPAKKNVYANIFLNEYNLSFHKPKKDLCKFCSLFCEMSPEEKEINKEKYEIHLKNKELSRQKKLEDKSRSAEETSFKSLTFDLQAVLYTPCSNVSSFFYTLKLCSYNFTIFDQSTKQGYCYFWTEVEGRRGSDEIGTCLLKFLTGLSNEIKEVSLYSDSCGGQNRNRYIASLLLYVTQNTNIDVIEHNFLESGHTEMEVDSMHSIIERNKKNQSVFSPSEWPAIIRNSRRKNPYEVSIMSFKDFVDLKHLKNQLTNSTLSKDVDGNNVNWLQIKIIQIRKTEPEKIFIKKNYFDEEFTTIPVSLVKRKRPVKQFLKQKYLKLVPVSEKKKNCLVNLCKKNEIKPVYHDFYLNLPTTKNVLDRIPEPDENEEEEEDVV